MNHVIKRYFESFFFGSVLFAIQQKFLRRNDVPFFGPFEFVSDKNNNNKQTNRK